MSGLLAPKLKLGIIHLGIILLVLIGLTAATSIALFAKNNPVRNFSFLRGGKTSPCGIYGDVRSKDGKISRDDVQLIENSISRNKPLINRPDNNVAERADVDGDGQVTTADVDLLLDYLSGDIATFPVCGEATPPQTTKRATCDFLSQRSSFKSTRLGGTDNGHVTDKSAQEIFARPQDWTKTVGPLFTTSKWGLQMVDRSAEDGGTLDVNADGFVNATDAELIRQFLAYQFLNFPACPPPPPANDIVYPRKNDPNSHYYDDVTSRCWPYGNFGGDAQMAQYFETIKGTDTLLPPSFQRPLLDLDVDGRVTGLDLWVLKYPPWPVCQKQYYQPDSLLAPRASAPKDCSQHGDINGDGRVSYDDVKTVFQLVRGETTLTDERQKAADTNGDGKITILDAIYIYKGHNSYYAPSKWPVCGMPDLITPAPADSALFRLPPCRHLGDVNGDGQIDDYDAHFIFAFASGFGSPTPQVGQPDNENRSDLNGDGVTGVSDGRLIRQYLAGEIDTFAACSTNGIASPQPRNNK